MKLKTVVKGEDWERAECGVIFVPEREKMISGYLARIDAISGGGISKSASAEDFKGKQGETLFFNLPGKKALVKILLVGLGPENKIEADSFRKGSGTIFLKVSKKKIKKISLLILPEVSKTITPYLMGKGIAEGFLLSSFEYSIHTEKKSRSKIDEIDISVETKKLEKEIKQGISDAVKVCEEVNYAREMVAAPANLMTPSVIASRAKKTASRAGIKCRVISANEAIKIGMNSFISVSKGSREPAKLIVLEYSPARSGKIPCVVLVGKGITFDSGGISLKPSKDMHKMKDDMAGGAAAIGAIAGCAKLKLPVKVVSIIPAAENLPGCNATKPGDVVKSLSGKTIEIQNTDAEGRLVLADAITYAKRFKPDAIIDIATLTGACIVALGYSAMGMMGNNRKLIDIINEAASLSYERVWEFPLWDDYAEDIKSDVADMKNIGNGSAGTIIGGIFLKQFVEEQLPWVHLDIAGTCWNERKHSYLQKGPTGSGVRLMVEILRIIAEQKKLLK